MFKKRTLLKSIFSFFLILEFFTVSILPVSALGGSIKIPSASQMASELENRYHLNLGSIQNQGEGFNVANNKVMVPEVSLFFSPSDPRPGEKISAKAFPIYFSNTEESLYYTWYLKRGRCDLDNNVTNTDILDLCNASDPNRGTSRRENPGDITAEDWKIEAARILAQNGYDSADADYSDDSDNDEYRAKQGGDNKVNTGEDFCYVYDTVSGKNYEVVRNLSPDSGCTGDDQPVCVANQNEVTSGEGGDGADVFTSGITSTSYISGYPTCSSSSLSCPVGQTAMCAASQSSGTTTFTAAGTCGDISKDSADPVCFHLFPNATDEESGDGEFGVGEERFWGTDPNDPSTADNGKKDEANVIGLGASTFTWNYATGDKVGVVVEGTSMLPTKHEGSSSMIMWAFPKKDCFIGNNGREDSDIIDTIGSYTDTVRGYAVNIPAVKLNNLGAAPLGKCFEKNLVDPTEGGQATRLEVVVTASPDNPVNDGSTDKSGDVVVVQANVNNAQRNVTDMLFDWKVKISKNISFTDTDNLDITSDLKAAGLLGNTKGNALSSIRLKLDMLDGTDSTIANYLNGGVGYLNFSVDVKENISDTAVRKGNSNVIVRFTSMGKKISAYTATAESDSTGTIAVMKVKVQHPDTDLICSGVRDVPAYENVLDRAKCRVTKNEIIGLKISEPLGSGHLSNFYWTVNGSPLTCSKRVSNDCDDTQQTNVNFFPVTGNPGDTYTVTVTANDVRSDNTVGTGNTVTLTRTFGVVAPAVTIKSVDTTGTIVWPRLLGQYRDITGSADSDGCSGGLCNDYSTTMFEAFPDSSLSFKATFIPAYLGTQATTTKEWSLDGAVIAESTSVPRTITFTADKPVGGIYNVDLRAQVLQGDATRRALLDIWGISPFDSPETNFSAAIQVQLQSPYQAMGPQSGPRKYLAAIVSYIPASVMFVFRIFLSVMLTIFALSFLYTLLEERRIQAFVENSPWKKVE